MVHSPYMSMINNKGDKKYCLSLCPGGKGAMYSEKQANLKHKFICHIKNVCIVLCYEF